ncbi:MAG: hypothetical protein F6K32_27315 [Desertifilum sp. SIO1I2]|nr:hypothetical protein [Desertifilum sp. SIO1I2]
MTQALNLNPIPYLLAIASATNLGSVATLSGNPQNILIGSFSQIGYLEFAQALTPIALVGLIGQIGLLWLLYPDVRSTQSITELPKLRYRIFKPLFSKTIAIALGLLIAFALGFPLGESALTAAALLLITQRVKPERILKQVDWNLLVLFSGLFILTQATQRLNLLGIFVPLTHTAVGLVSVVTVLSNLISNVPTVLLLQPLIEAEDTRSWLLLAASSTLAGNLTLFGAVANLIMVESAAKLGYQLTFWEHLRFGVPLTLAMVVFTYFWLH